MKWFLPLTFLVLFLPLNAYGVNVTFIVQDETTKQALLGAYIKVSDQTAVTNLEGKANISLPLGTFEVEVSYLGYETLVQEITLREPNEEILLYISEANTLLHETVITGSRHEIEVSKSTVSIDVISPKLLERNNLTSADQALQRVPGVEIIDKQPNIRGGSGYSYGAGSRVLVLLDDIPILQADAGFPQWDDLPIELTSQIEVLKGASSALYGSAALNGIINLRTAYATSTPETKFTTFATAFSRPKDEAQAWWTDRPGGYGSFLSHKQKLGKTDLVLGMFGKNLDSYNKDVSEKYWRYTGSIMRSPNERLRYGFNFNVNSAENEEFFFWKGIDSLYVGSPNTESKVTSLRYNIDPKLTYYANDRTQHKLLGRYHFVNNQTNANRSNQSKLGYLEYQFTKKLPTLNATIHSGLVNMASTIQAELYGDQGFTTYNNAAYVQWDQELWNRLTYNIGLRYERNAQSTPELVYNRIVNPFSGEREIDTLAEGFRTEAKPVVRTGVNYQLAKATFIRASYGQGYRYPTIAEQYISTNFGGVPITANPELTSETGTSLELGIKQGFSVRKQYHGFIDIAVFESRYNNMIEFNFVDLSPTGFRSVNVGGTQIRGIEVTLVGTGKLGTIEIDHLIGYNSIDPRFQEFEDVAVPETEGQLNAYYSSYKQNVLKYRYNTTFKYDLELSYKTLGLGFSGNYYSHMLNVDIIFEDFIVPDLKEFRQADENGTWVLNARLNYTPNPNIKIGLLLNNMLNEMYSLRPGLMEAPRNIALRMTLSL